MAVDLNSITSEYPFKPKSLSINGLNYSYLDEGSGEIIVMLHGNPTWSFYYRNLVKELRADYRVIVPDHMGCGLSSKPQDYDYCLKNHIENLTTLLNRLNIEKATLVMHDWGGAIAMGYATANPEKIKKLVVFNTAAFLSKRIPPSINLCKLPYIGEFIVRGLNGFVGPAINCNFATAKPELLTKEIREGYLSPYSSWSERIAISRFVEDIPMKPSHRTWNLMKSIEEKLSLFKNNDMLICWGMKDFCFNEQFLNRWVKEFPSAEVHRFNHAGHFVLEDAREEIVPLLKNFLGKQ